MACRPCIDCTAASCAAARGPEPEPTGSGPWCAGARSGTQRFREHHPARRPGLPFAGDSARRPPQDWVTGSDTCDVRAPARSRPFLSVPVRSSVHGRLQKRRFGRHPGRVHALVDLGGHFSANVWRANHPKPHPANAARNQRSRQQPPTCPSATPPQLDTVSADPRARQPGTHPMTTPKARNVTLSVTPARRSQSLRPCGGSSPGRGPGVSRGLRRACSRRSSIGDGR